MPPRDLTDLWHMACRAMLFGTKRQLTVASLTVVQFDKVLRADTMDYDVDISKELWLTAGRFTGLQRDYLDPIALEDFKGAASRMKSKRPQIAQMLCRRKGQRHVSYKWGNCILGMTFRLMPEPTFVMHSRTSAITRMGGLDLGLAYHVLLEVLEECPVELEPAEVRFVWHLDSIQHSALQGVPYLYAHELEEELPDYDEPNHPAVRIMNRQLTYFDRLDREGKVQVHGTRRRVREQRRAFLDGKLEREAVPITSLDLGGLDR